MKYLTSDFGNKISSYLSDGDTKLLKQCKSVLTIKHILSCIKYSSNCHLTKFRTGFYLNQMLFYQ